MEKGWTDFDLKPIKAGKEATFLVFDSDSGQCLETIGFYIIFGNLILFKPKNIPDYISVKIAVWKK